ncbi:hypothetical protein [Variovorax sp. H27-G14]|uniref:hypothetical protein n=1 Tax=Variovorax sp. H27-G14 TaxID=3111914 RepID=UPI0038FD0437
MAALGLKDEKQFRDNYQQVAMGGGLGQANPDDWNKRESNLCIEVEYPRLKAPTGARSTAGTNSRPTPPAARPVPR